MGTQVLSKTGKDYYNEICSHRMSDYSHQGTKGDTTHRTFLKSIRNKGISQGNNGLWTPNKATTLALTYNIILKLKLWQHESITCKWNFVTYIAIWGYWSQINSVWNPLGPLSIWDI